MACLLDFHSNYKKVFAVVLVRQLFIKAAFHQSGNSSKRQFIKVAIHQSGNSLNEHKGGSNGQMCRFDEVAVVLHFLANSSKVL